MTRALSIGLTLWALAAMAAWLHLDGPARWLPGVAWVFALAVVAARGPTLRVELRHLERAPTHLDLTLAQPLTPELDWVVDVEATTPDGKTVSGRAELSPR